ncbi:MAG: HDOD domain-containing protein [Desulfobacterales bacterium]
MKVESFPGLPRSGVKIMALLQDESNASVSEIEKILRYDPGLTANFLKLANSPYFGIPARVSSVKQSIVLLGTNRLKQIVLATCASDVLGTALPGYNLAAGDLWRHSIAVSNAAVSLAKYRKLPEPNNIFTPGLLHDIGKLVLGRFVEKHFKVINELLLSGLPLEVAENMVLGTDHAEIGAQILTQWSFPPDVVNAVRLHHYPDLMHNTNIENDLLYLANLFCQLNGTNNKNDMDSVSIYPALRKRLGIEQDKLDAIYDQITKWVDGISEKLILN